MRPVFSVAVMPDGTVELIAGDQMGPDHLHAAGGVVLAAARVVRDYPALFGPQSDVQGQE